MALSQVIGQGVEQVIPQLQEHKLDELRANYVSVFGQDPLEEADPSDKQLTALSWKLEAGLTPYADFGVWGPFGARQERAMRFVNHIQAADGTYRAVEMAGPRDLATWRRCYHVFKSAAVMLKVAHPAVLERCEALFEGCCSRFPDAWHILVMADVRCRSEFSAKRNAGFANFTTSAHRFPIFDAGMPWNSVIKSAGGDLAYWHRSVDQPALEYSVNNGRSGAGRTVASISQSASSSAAPAVMEKRKQPELPSGWQSHNTKGIEICRKWNASANGCEAVCPARRAHQCSICLNTHRACQPVSGKGGGKAGKSGGDAADNVPNKKFKKKGGKK